MMVLLGGQTPAQGGRYAVTRLEGTPLAEDGFLFVSDGWGAIYKVDVRSGTAPTSSGSTTRRSTRCGPATSPAAASTTAASACGRTASSPSPSTAACTASTRSRGQVIWERKVYDPGVAETLTVAPLVIRDLAIVGSAGAEYGIRGSLDATDLNTGKQVWRTHTAGGNDRDPEREGQDHLARHLQRVGDRRRLDLADRHLRSEAQPDVLGHRQRRPRLRPGVPARRQSLRRRRCWR